MNEFQRTYLSVVLTVGAAILVTVVTTAERTAKPDTLVVYVEPCYATSDQTLLFVQDSGRVVQQIEVIHGLVPQDLLLRMKQIRRARVLLPCAKESPDKLDSIPTP